jgi:TolA-binding protein
MDDPTRDDVEKILTLLVQLCVKKAHAAPPPAEVSADASPGAAPAATPEASPTPPPDPGAELDRLLGGMDFKATPTKRARIIFCKAQLAGLQKQPKEETKQFQAIADHYKPADLSATILAETADHMVTAGHFDQAAALYQELTDSYPRSDQIDAARVGLGEIAYQKKDYSTALRYFTEAVDKSTTTAKLKDATLGKGATLLALNQLDEAKKLFEQVAATREWRGPATAQSVFSLGQIASKQGKLPEAIAYYQRVYVAYQRYLPWVAKAYLASGELFEKMGKIPEAINTYNEMLRNDKLQTFPETEEARQRLQSLGQR